MFAVSAASTIGITLSILITHVRPCSVAIRVDSYLISLIQVAYHSFCLIAVTARYSINRRFCGSDLHWHTPPAPITRFLVENTRQGSTTLSTFSATRELPFSELIPVALDQ